MDGGIDVHNRPRHGKWCWKSPFHGLKQSNNSFEGDKGNTEDAIASKTVNANKVHDIADEDDVMESDDEKGDEDTWTIVPQTVARRRSRSRGLVQRLEKLSIH